MPEYLRVSGNVSGFFGVNQYSKLSSNVPQGFGHWQPADRNLSPQALPANRGREFYK
jgi:hypothetical protein